MSAATLSCLQGALADACTMHRMTYCFGTASRYLHSTFFSLQLLQGLSSSHLALSCLQLSHAYSTSATRLDHRRTKTNLGCPLGLALPRRRGNMDGV